MKKLNLVLITILSISALVACTPTPAASSSQNKKAISISGAFALYPLMQRWSEEYQKQYSEVTFDISAGGAGKGMTDTLSGSVDMGMISREISPDEENKGAYWVAIAKDAVFPTINTKNPVYADLIKKGINQKTLMAIYITGDIKTWGEVVGRPEIKDEIHVYTRSDACGAADTWSKYLGNKKQENLLGIGVSGDPGILDTVIKDSFGIGYNNLGYIFDSGSGKPPSGIITLPIDRNENGLADADELLDTRVKALEAINTGKYPSPPARLLYLTTRGKPTGEVQKFLEWILTDGQKYVPEAGYIVLPVDQINHSLEKVR